MFHTFLKELNKIRIEAAIPDVHGKTFWRMNFHEKGKIKFKQFVEAFFKQSPELGGSIPEDKNQSIPLSGYIGEIAPLVDKADEKGDTIDIDKIKLILLRLLRILFGEKNSYPDSRSSFITSLSFFVKLRTQDQRKRRNMFTLSTMEDVSLGSGQSRTIPSSSS